MQMNGGSSRNDVIALCWDNKSPLNTALPLFLGSALFPSRRDTPKLLLSSKHYTPIDLGSSPSHIYTMAENVSKNFETLQIHAGYVQVS